MYETVIQMRIAEFESAITVLSSKADSKEKLLLLDDYLRQLRKLSETLIAKMEMSE